MSPPLRTAPLAVLLLGLASAPLLAQPPSAPGDLEAKVRELADQVSALAERAAAQERTIADLRSETTAATEARARAEERVREFESREREADLTRRLDEALSRLAAGHLPSPEEERLRWGGYFDLEFREDKAGDHRAVFDQHRLVLQARATVAEGIAFDTEIEIEGGGIGPSYLTDSYVAVEFAELEFEFDEAFAFRAGALLVPFGRYNLLHDSPLQELTDRPFVARRIVPTTWTEAGIGVSGVFGPEAVTFDYDVILVNGLTDSISATNGTRNARGSFRNDNNDSKMVIGRVGISAEVPFLDHLGAGFSLAHGKYDDGNQESLTLFGFDLAVRKGPFEVVGEYAKLNLSRGDDEIAAGVPGGMEGWYVEARFRWWFDSWTGAMPFFTPESRFALIARWDSADTDTGATAVDFAARGDRYRDDRERLTIGFNFRPVAKTVLKIEYQWIFEPDAIEDVDNNRFVASLATSF